MRDANEKYEPSMRIERRPECNWAMGIMNTACECLMRVPSIQKIISRFTVALAAVMVLFSAASVQAAPYLLGPGDKLRLSVYEWPALTGEFTISAEGTLSLPQIGAIQAIKRSTTEVAQTVATRLQESAKLLKTPDVTVEVISYRPYFVFGQVKRPGEYNYRPGINVLAAFAVAGGAPRMDDDVSIREERNIRIDEAELHAGAIRVIQLKLRLKRLEAEARAETKLDLQRELADNRDDPAYAKFVSAEMRAFDGRLEAYKRQLTIFEQLSKLYDGETTAVAQNVAAQGRLQASIEKELGEVRNLVARGLTPAPRQLALEREANAVEIQKRDLETRQLNIQQRMSENQKDIVLLGQNRVNEALATIITTQYELLQQETKIDDLKNMVAKTKENIGSVAEDELDEKLRFRVFRTENGTVKDTVVSGMEPVMPDDLIQVERPRKTDRPLRVSKGQD